MGFFRRYFSPVYRQAVAAEAEGDFLSAARNYALCGESHKVLEMHLAQARLENTVEGRIRELRIALNFTPAKDQRRPMVLRLLANALLEQGRHLGASSRSGRDILRQAASLLEQGESWEQAGDCFMELGQGSRAVDAYSKGGLVKKVEEVLNEQERSRTQERREDSTFKDYELLLQAGKRDEAADSLRACIEAAQRKGDYRKLLARLEANLLTTGRITLQVGKQRIVVVGRYPLVLGRDPDCDVPLRGHSISRRHTRLLEDAAGGRLLVEDAGSRNGTCLGGMPLGSALALPGSGILSLGEDCEVSFTILDPDTAAVLLEVTRGLDRGTMAAVSTAPLDLSRLTPAAPPLLISFERGRPMAAASGAMLKLNQAQVGDPIQLIRGDEVELDGRTVVVI